MLEVGGFEDRTSTVTKPKTSTIFWRVLTIVYTFLCEKGFS